MASDRFLTLPDVAEVLNISQSQTYALVRSQELKAIKIGGRGQWRVEREELEAYIRRMYDETQAFLSRDPAAALDELEESEGSGPGDDTGSATGTGTG